MRIPVNFNARKYQAKALRALENGCVMNIWCWARRAGKDKTGFSYGVKKMIEQPMNVVLVFPTKKQGYDSFWTNVENDGFKTLDAIPKELRVAESNSKDDMKITLINGSTFTLLGAKDPEALRGANGKLYIFSEFVDIDAVALGVIRPIVAVNGGQIIVQSTPKIDGISGGTFKILFDRALKNPKQFASLVTAHEYLTDEQLEELRQDIIAQNGNDFFYRQEFLCDWGQASATTYYGQILKKMEKQERIGLYAWNSKYPVYTVWDLGMADSTALTFWQYYKENGLARVRIIDYYETDGIGSKAIYNFVIAKQYNYTWHFLPHDGAVRDSDAIQRIEKLRDLGLVNSSLLRRESVDAGIERVSEMLPLTVINKATTTALIAKLYLYKRKYNPLTGDYVGPEHKTESHAADTIRYLFTAIDQEFEKDSCDMYYSQESVDEEYESEEALTSFYDPNYSH